ncbi:MAG TPA: DUF1203 domain-containing protein [Caldimonas sp.]|nr:DUF1203 domain-containing protein [Caldimonas sp.]
MSDCGERGTAGDANIAHRHATGLAMPSFQIVGLSPTPFEELFALPPDELAPRGIRRVRAASSPGYPCRISLEDAQAGDELLLLPFEHQPARSPYRASGPIYVKVGARQRTMAFGEVPESVRRRQISLRAYDVEDLIVDAEVCEGESVRAEIERLMADPRVRYVHLHNAKRGCYSCLARRVA